MIPIETFKAVEITLGKICAVERVPDTDKLLRLTVDFGPIPPADADAARESSDTELTAPGDAPRDMRQVVSGIAGYLPDASVLIGKVVPFVTNLEPRTIRGLTSEAMILAGVAADGTFSVLETTLAPLPAGTRLS